MTAPLVSRRFPRLAWAWPDGGRHLLIMAAICPDDDRAFAAITQWLQDTDLDDATFAEHRLLAAITTRFDARLAHHPEYARLCGLQRLNWTRSRMAISTCRPALEQMVDAGLQVILLKGACRVALDMSEQKSRTSYDLDLLLGPADFDRAFEILAADGWQSTRGESALGLRARLSSVRARNFKKGRFGDIDLHRHAYHTARSQDDCDAQLFRDIQPVTFYDQPVFIPGPEERLAMAIGHGGWDGQSHSDWLVDVARILQTEQVDWDKFLHIITARRLRGAAAIALSYLDQAIGLPVPDAICDGICREAVIPKPSQVAAVLLAKEAESLSRGQNLARACVVSYHRIWHSGRDKGADTPVFRALTKTTGGDPAAQYALSQPVALPEAAQAGRWQFAITVAMPAPQRRRRIEMELNSADRNICHLQAFHLRKKADVVLARFSGEIVTQPDDVSLVISALPGKLIENAEGGADQEKYGAIPFAVTKADFRFRG